MAAAVSVPVTREVQPLRLVSKPSKQSYLQLLQAAFNELQDQIDAIREEGAIAPSAHWIVEIQQQKRNKVYNYVRLCWEADGKRRQRLIGKPGGNQHIEWIQKCDRRDRINELATQLTILSELIDRASV
jgi:hypothetical protein